jgi:hypothetical protein
MLKIMRYPDIKKSAKNHNTVLNIDLDAETLATIVLAAYKAAESRLSQLLLHSVIPGPRKPKDIDSFLYPLIQELKILHHGVTAYNGATKSDISLRAHVITITAEAASYAPPGDVALRTDRRRQRLPTEKTSCVRPGPKVFN